MSTLKRGLKSGFSSRPRSFAIGIATGIQVRKAGRTKSNLRRVLEIAQKFEKENNPEKTRKMYDLFQEVFIRTAFTGRVKRFVEQALFRMEITDESKQTAAFWRSLGIRWRDNSWHLFSTRERQREIISKIDPKMAKKLIMETKRQLNRAIKIVEGLVFSLKATTNYPQTAAHIRHTFFNFKDTVLLRLLTLEAEVEKPR